MQICSRKHLLFIVSTIFQALYLTVPPFMEGDQRVVTVRMLRAAVSENWPKHVVRGRPVPAQT